MASIPGFRVDITGASGSQGLLSPRSGYRCYVLPRGGYAAQDSTGTLITFDSASVASRFAVNNWVQAGLLTANIRQVGSVGGNSINVSGAALTVSENNRIYLIGNTEPTVSGGSATYNTPNTIIRQRDDDAADLYTNSMITTNADGLAQGFGAPALYDIIIQDGNLANQGSIIDMEVGTVEGVSVTDTAYFGSTVTFSGNMTGVSVTGAAIFGSTLTVNGALGVTGWATFGSSVTMHANLGVTGSVVVGGSVTVGGNVIVTGDITGPAFGNIRWAHLYATGSETGGIQEAINSITGASATNPYTVMLRPGTYNVDRGISAGTQTGVAGFTANGTNITGVGTSFQSTIALTGTVTMTTGSSQVTGSGTLFSTELQTGDSIQMTSDADDTGGTDASGAFARVLSIQGNTQLTLEVVSNFVYDGAGGTGAARFREFRVGNHIKAAADPDSAYTRITAIASDTSMTVSGSEADPILVGYRGTTLVGAGITKKTFYQTGICLFGTRGDGGWNTGADIKDYIYLAGMDRESCIIKRTRAAGTLTGVIQAGDNFFIHNLTIFSSATRSIHWDTGSPSISLRSHNVRYRGTNAGLSTGIGVATGATSHSIMVLTDNIVDGQFAIHDSSFVSSSYWVLIYIVGNTFNAEGTAIGLSWLTNAGVRYRVHIAGNIQPYNNVDPGGGTIDLNMPTAAANGAYIVIYTDGVFRINDSVNPPAVTNNSSTYLFNTLSYPMERTGYQDTIGSSSGDVLIYRPATADLGTTTSVAAQWPVVVCNQNDRSGAANWWPRLCTGPYGVCFVESGTTVSTGDTLVTSGTSWTAGVSNTVTDMTRVIGWAFSGKTAGTTRGLVNFRRNMTLGW